MLWPILLLFAHDRAVPHYQYCVHLGFGAHSFPLNHVQFSDVRCISSG